MAQIFLSPNFGSKGEGLGVRVGILEGDDVPMDIPGSPLDRKELKVVDLDTAAAVDKAALMLQLAMKGHPAEIQAAIVGAFLESLNHPPRPMEVKP